MKVQVEIEEFFDKYIIYVYSNKHIYALADKIDDKKQFSVEEVTLRWHSQYTEIRVKAYGTFPSYSDELKQIVTEFYEQLD